MLNRLELPVSTVLCKVEINVIAVGTYLIPAMVRVRATVPRLYLYQSTDFYISCQWGSTDYEQIGKEVQKSLPMEWIGH